MAPQHHAMPAREEPRRADTEHDRDIDRRVIDVADRIEFQASALARGELYVRHGEADDRGRHQGGQNELHLPLRQPAPLHYP